MGSTAMCRQAGCGWSWAEPRLTACRRPTASSSSVPVSTPRQMTLSLIRYRVWHVARVAWPVGSRQAIANTQASMRLLLCDSCTFCCYRSIESFAFSLLFSLLIPILHLSVGGISPPFFFPGSRTGDRKNTGRRIPLPASKPRIASHSANQRCSEASVSPGHQRHPAFTLWLLWPPFSAERRRRHGAQSHGQPTPSAGPLSDSRLQGPAR